MQCETEISSSNVTEKKKKIKLEKKDLCRTHLLSFDDEEEENEELQTHSFLRKDPLANTTFLPVRLDAHANTKHTLTHLWNPSHMCVLIHTCVKSFYLSLSTLQDAEREKLLMEKRSKLVEEYNAEQEIIRKQPFTVAFNYWNGTGMSFMVYTSQSLQLIFEQPQSSRALRLIDFSRTASDNWYALSRSPTHTHTDTHAHTTHTKSRHVSQSDFAELRGLTENDLMLVKEDTILPNQITFYELLRDKVTTATGWTVNECL